MKHIKILGLVALSAMALMALWGTASTSASSFTSNKTGKSLTSATVNQHVFTITGSEAKCNSSVFTGVTGGTESGGSFHTESQKVHPEYTGCEAFGFPANVSTNGCDYTFKANTDANGMATVSIIDHPGETCNGIVITADLNEEPFRTTCTAVIPKQSLANAVSYTNGSGTLRVKATATGIETNVTASTGLCPLTTGIHNTTNSNAATYHGETNVTAEGGVNWTA